MECFVFVVLKLVFYELVTIIWGSCGSGESRSLLLPSYPHVQAPDKTMNAHQSLTYTYKKYASAAWVFVYKSVNNKHIIFVEPGED